MQIVPSSHCKGAGVEYRILLDVMEGTVSCDVEIATDTVDLTADIEPLAIAAGVVEKRGGITCSARNLSQLQKSLRGQADYVRLVHPILADPTTAEPLMRKSGAREWIRHSPSCP
nr:hypothetical protein [Streptomyces antibioticus]